MCVCVCVLKVNSENQWNELMPLDCFRKYCNQFLLPFQVWLQILVSCTYEIITWGYKKNSSNCEWSATWESGTKENKLIVRPPVRMFYLDWKQNEIVIGQKKRQSWPPHLVVRVRKWQTEKCSNLLHFHAYIVLPMCSVLFACCCCCCCYNTWITAQV